MQIAEVGVCQQRLLEAVCAGMIHNRVHAVPSLGISILLGGGGLSALGMIKVFEASQLHMQEPCMQTHQGAVMITDITGFTALTEDLGRRGAAGVELLTRCMNDFFTLVIELVRSLSQTCSKQRMRRNSSYRHSPS